MNNFEMREEIKKIIDEYDNQVKNNLEVKYDKQQIEKLKKHIDSFDLFNILSEEMKKYEQKENILGSNNVQTQNAEGRNVWVNQYDMDKYIELRNEKIDLKKNQIKAVEYFKNNTIDKIKESVLLRTKENEMELVKEILPFEITAKDYSNMTALELEVEELDLKHKMRYFIELANKANCKKVKVSNSTYYYIVPEIYSKEAVELFKCFSKVKSLQKNIIKKQENEQNIEKPKETTTEKPKENISNQTHNSFVVSNNRCADLSKVGRLFVNIEKYDDEAQIMNAKYEQEKMKKENRSPKKIASKVKNLAIKTTNKLNRIKLVGSMKVTSAIKWVNNHMLPSSSIPSQDNQYDLLMQMAGYPLFEKSDNMFEETRNIKR